jgi:hypothetical protein
MALVLTFFRFLAAAFGAVAKLFHHLFVDFLHHRPTKKHTFGFGNERYK